MLRTKITAVTIILSAFLAAGTPVSAQVIEGDSLALVALYNALDGPNWIKQMNWLSGPVASWQGVGVADGRVKTLFHIEDNMTGQIPPEIGDLTAIEFINIYCNKLSGPIPPELGNLIELRTLIVSINDLEGPIPDELAGLTKLKNLLLGDNAFTGEIPSWLGDLSELETLYLWRNELTGQIPPDLGRLSNLEELDLSNNELTGGLPTELGNLDSLRYLSVGSQPLHGPLPQSLTGLTKLSLFHYAGTEICEPGDAGFQSWLGSIDDIERTGVTCVSSTAAEGANVAPTRFRLVGNYPNPFNPSTTIHYDVAEPTEITLRVFDLNGRLVAPLVSRTQAPGRHSVQWHASGLAGGTYLLRLDAKTFSDVETIVLAK